MRCPYCSNIKSKVTNKRDLPNKIRRRRECLKCKRRYTTYEQIQKNDLYVIKKDGRRELFDREKLLRGVDRAFEKRPVSKDKIEKMANSIEEQLRKNGHIETKSSKMGEMIMKKIKQIDNVAYIRFASVYRNFSDIKDFKQELKGL